MPKLTHKTRAIRKLESMGWTVADVEQNLRHSFVKRDLFNFADLLAVKPGVGTLALQVTDTTNVSKRVNKILDEPRVVDCLQTGWLIEVWGVEDKSNRFALARTIVLSGEEIVAIEGSEVLNGK